MLRNFFSKLWKDEAGILPIPPPVDPITTAIFLGSLIFGGSFFRRLFGGDSQEQRADNFSQAVVDAFGAGEFNIDFAGFSAFRSAAGADMFFSRPVFGIEGFQQGTAFFSSATGELAQVRDSFGNLTGLVPGILQGRFTWTSASEQDKDRDKRKNALEGSLELAIKNELKKTGPIENLEQTDETRARARCTGSGLTLVNGTHCATPDAVSACNAVGGAFENGVCVTIPLPPGEDPTFTVDVNDCEQRGGTPVGNECIFPSTELSLTGPIPRPPFRSRTGAPTPIPGAVPIPGGDPEDPTFTAEGIGLCPEGTLRDSVTLECISPTQIPPLPGIPPPGSVTGVPPVVPPVPPASPTVPPVVPPTAPHEAPDPRIPALGLANLINAGGGFSPGFASPTVVGAGPQDTLFPAEQAQSIVPPGLLLQLLASMIR